MAGHSQFKNIMHRKGAQDAKRAKIFTKLSKEISVAVKEGGENPEFNPRLRAALLTARGYNMPKDNIEKAVKKATGSQQDDFESITYEGYAPYGVALIIETLTNNRNRTASDIRSVFNKFHGSMGVSGSVSFLFDHRGVLTFSKKDINFNALFETAVNLDALDVFEEPDHLIVITQTNQLYQITSGINKALNIEAESSSFSWLPKVVVTIEESQIEVLEKMVNTLEEHEDVQKVFTNTELFLS